MSRAAPPGAPLNVDQTSVQTEANKLSPKILYATAIVVGVAALFFGACGTTGLLQAYGKIHLAASWFTEAATWMGHAGLWALAVTGTTAGAIFTPLGIYKMVKGTPENEENLPTGPTTPSPAKTDLPDGFSADKWINMPVDINFDTCSLQNGQFALIDIDGSLGYFLLRDSSGNIHANNITKHDSRPATETALESLGYTAGFVLYKEHFTLLSQFRSDTFNSTFTNPKYKSKIERELTAKGAFLIAGNLPNGCSTCVIRDFDNQLKCITPRPQNQCLDKAGEVYRVGFKEIWLSKKKK